MPYLSYCAVASVDFLIAVSVCHLIGQYCSKEDALPESSWQLIYTQHKNSWSPHSLKSRRNGRNSLLLQAVLDFVCFYLKIKTQTPSFLNKDLGVCSYLQGEIRHYVSKVNVCVKIWSCTSHFYCRLVMLPRTEGVPKVSLSA